MPDSRFFTPPELSERYRGTITERTLANWRSNGEGPPFVKVGGKILYPLKSLLEWEMKRTFARLFMCWASAGATTVFEFVDPTTTYDWIDRVSLVI